MASLADDFRLFGRILTFRASAEELTTMSWRLLIIGLICTWLVGIGRWWDDPRPEIPPFARAGLGSVTYIFGLSTLLWLAAWPLSRPRLHYRQMLTFVACTSPPAILYAVPIERWVSQSQASTYNLQALLVVAIYRVALLFWYLHRAGRLTWGEVFLTGLLPIMTIISFLTAIGWEARVIEIMGGLREERPATDSEAILGLIGCLGYLFGPIVLIGYSVVAGMGDVHLSTHLIRWRTEKGWKEDLRTRLKRVAVVSFEGKRYLEIRIAGRNPLRFGEECRGFRSFTVQLERAGFGGAPGTIRNALAKEDDDTTIIYENPDISPLVFENS